MPIVYLLGIFNTGLRLPVVWYSICKCFLTLEDLWLPVSYFFYHLICFMSYPYRIFLIDDDEDDGYIFNVALSNLPHNFELMYYQDSEKALATLSDAAFNPPDMLFIDWNMPKVSGNQCLQSIRKLPGYATIPIIICSTSHHVELQKEARQSGASHFLAKPSNIKDLTEKLKDIFIISWENN